MDLHEKEKMYQRLIIFTLLIGMVIYYFEKIIRFLGWIGQMCLPFLLGAGLAFVFNIISNNLMRYSIKWFDIKDTKIKRIISNVLSVLIVFAVFVAFVGIVIPRILFSIQLLLTNFPKMIYELYIWLLDVTKNIDVIHDSLKNLDINAFSTFAIDNVSKKISSWLISGGANDIFGSIFTILSTTFSWFAQAFITIVFSFLLLFNKEQVVHETKSLLKAYLPEKNYDRVRHVYKTHCSHIYKLCGRNLFRMFNSCKFSHCRILDFKNTIRTFSWTCRGYWRFGTYVWSFGCRHIMRFLYCDDIPCTRSNFYHYVYLYPTSRRKLYLSSCRWKIRWLSTHVYYCCDHNWSECCRYYWNHYLYSNLFMYLSIGE